MGSETDDEGRRHEGAAPLERPEEALDPKDLEAQGQGDEPDERIVHALHERIAELGERIEA